MRVLENAPMRSGLVVGVGMATSMALTFVQPGADLNVLFARGLTWSQFLSGVTNNRESWERNARRAEVPDDLVRTLRAVREHVKVLIVAEDWCKDSVNTVPYIAKLTSSAGLETRVINRQLGHDLMNIHRTPDGRLATPTVVLLRNGRDAASWVERPAGLQEWFLAESVEIGSEQDNKRHQQLEFWHEGDQGKTTVAEIVRLAVQIASKR